MKHLKHLFVLVAAAMASGGILAQVDPKIDITVIPTPDKVTLSRPAGKAQLPLDSLAAFLVSFKNKTTNDLRRVFLTGSAINVGATDTIFYDSIVPITLGLTDHCDVGATPNVVNCDLGSISPGSSKEFLVVYKAPQHGSGIEFKWTAGGDEGKSQTGNGCCNKSDTAKTDLIDPSTDPSFQVQAQSFVKPSTGGTVFTGGEAITTSSDGWTTIVGVPIYDDQPQPFSVASIREFSKADTPTLACPSYSTSSTCFGSQLSIPGSFKSLEITIRLDKNYFNLGRTDPSTLSLNYTGDTVPSPYPYVSYPHTLRPCTEDETNYGSFGDIPLPGRPCLSALPQVLPNNYPIKDLRGDLQFKARARDNGRYVQ